MLFNELKSIYALILVLLLIRKNKLLINLPDALIDLILLI